MAIVSSEIKLYKSSQGVGLGGAISGVEILTGALNNIFDNVDASEGAAGATEYRCIYVKNTNTLLALISTIVYFLSNTPSAQTSVLVGLGTSGVNGVETPIASDTTAPGGVTFSSAPDFISGLAIGDIPSNGYRAIWIKRIVDVGAAAYNNDGFSLTVKGQTSA